MEPPFLFSILTLVAAAVSGQFHLKTQDTKQVAEVGSNTFLPCTLSSPQGLSELKVHWFRSLYHSTVFLMSNGKEEKERQSSEYSGRTVLRSQPDTGDLTLMLRNVSLSDTDMYHCLVENISSEAYKEVVIELIVIGIGSIPVLGVSLQDNSIGISFITSDWFPIPEMHWEVDGNKLVTGQENIHNQSNGLFQLQSRIVLKSPSDRHVYGAVRHPVTGKEVGLYMEIAADMFPRLSSWAYAFIFIFLILTAGVIITIVHIKKQHKQKVHLQQAIDDLSSEVAWRQAVMTPEYITLCPETAHPELSVAPSLATLMNEPPMDPPPPTNSRFETERCCLGLPAFSSGCHYWEVELGDCLEWAVGVASPEVQRKGHAYMFRPQENIWCISRFMEDFRALDNQEAPLPFEQPERVGVYLNLSGPRQITFYDPTSWDKLYTFNNVGHGRGNVLPFFWLGRNGNKLRLKGRDQ
ncbi:butyrophilin subfamily 2 member A2-like isoform X1 [Bufo bufo]|uniref:butyrophilin subfamily 2 member A2-like isoform X1 n=2 Tax=Bufo bufo TaxID=8384 RepID=UPI001ABE80A7|nr:butyrophilin subfamily 2 member A2-like isoform X1 [Bufo bufo]XP_040262002.1 butyrophilin subfamily 2 member A2-like isoform X1 [Bufo bufo]